MHVRLIRSWVAAAALLAAGSLPAQEPNENCVITLLDRTAQVDERGFWRIDNVPANQGPVRARVICTGIRDLDGHRNPEPMTIFGE